MIDKTCSTEKINFDNFYQNLSNLNFDINEYKPFLCEILNISTIEDLDSIFYSDVPINYELKYLNFDSLSATGDPRISLGEILSSVYFEFADLAATQIEIIRSGGCQILDNYICDSQGNKKKKIEKICPDNYKLEPIKSEDIQNKTLEYIERGIKKHANNFIDYLKSLDFNMELWVYKNFPIFYIRFEKNQKISYFKYFFDAKDYISEKLNIDIKIRNNNNIDNLLMLNVLNSNIPLLYQKSVLYYGIIDKKNEFSN